MTDSSPELGNGESPPRRPDPGARRAQLDALRATRSTPGTGSAAAPRRRGHAALASRVLSTGLAAGTAVGLIGILAQADQAGADAKAEAEAQAGYGPAGAVGFVGSRTLALNITTPTVGTSTTTAPPTTAPPAATPGAPQPSGGAAPSSSGGGSSGGGSSAGSAPAPQVAAPPVTAPPVTAPPVTAPPVTAPPVTTPPASSTGAS